VTKETAPLLASIWSEALEDVPTEALEPILRATLRSCKWFPTVADILSHVESAEGARCEDEWQRLLEYCRRWVNPDIGMERAPKLPADIAHAANAAGGLYFLESCSTDNLVWAKKRFIEDLTRQRESGDIAACLPDSPLGKLLEAAAPRFSLPSPPAVPTDPRKALEVLRSLRDLPSEPLYSARRDESNPDFVRWQDRHAEAQCAEYRKEHGLEVPKTPPSAPPQVVETTSLAGVGREVRETCVSGTGAID